jgi:pilus assembly protein CpaE
MSPVVFISPAGNFEVRFDAVLGPSESPRRRWHEECLRVDPTKVVDAFGKAGVEVVCLGPDLAPESALTLAEAFDRDRPDLCVVLLAEPTAALWEGALRAGVRDVISPRADDQTLASALRRALEVADRRRATLAHATAPVTTATRVITVLAPKGGTGKTTVATNLGVGLARSHPGRVALVDLDLQFGDVGAALGLRPEQSMADVTRAPSNLDATMLKVFLTPHDSGLFALCAPETPVEADDITSAHTGAAIDLLASEFAFVIIDTAAGVEDRALAAIERSTDLVFVGSMDVASVRSLRKETEVLDQLGMTAARRHLVLNRADAKVGMEVRDIEAFLGMRVDVAIPSSRLVPLSTNEGVPVLDRDAKAPVARSLLELVGRFTDSERTQSAGVGSYRRRRGKEGS